MGLDYSEESAVTPATENEIDGSSYRIGVAVSRFNHKITSALYRSAIKELTACGVNEDSIFTIHTPGAFELPLAAKSLFENSAVDAVIIIGCVIRGETPHFDYICQACSMGAQNVSLEKNRPVIFGVLTTENLQQALDRAGGGDNNDRGDKGREAATAALQMLAALNEKNQATIVS
ncbi:MAG: 6,7-dimethyl-8-ribityllumazine synthase [candidate division Zixibacteria bacterium]|nr:6,7-dimethyl-8-ribityllumazine synthase [candidate division Zixibacteria bacterium]